ncbi:MAG: hypothetical protein RIA71_11945 [Oceanicaulis sp.]
MRWVFRIGFAVLAVLVIGVLGVISAPWVPVLRDQFGADPHRAWLAEHQSHLAAADMFEDDFSDSRFIILAEMHGYAAVQDADLTLVRHFAQRGPTTYLAELDPGQAIAFNQYLAGGDESAARAVFDAWADQTLQWANTEFFAKLTALAAHNASSPQDEQIWFVGVDRPASSERLAAQTALVTAQASPGFDSVEAVQALNLALAEAALGRPETSSRYAHIVANIDMLVATESARDRTFYGLWGLFHGAKTTVNGATPLAVHLDAPGGAFEGAVGVISTMCLDACMNLMPTAALPDALHGPDGTEYVEIPITFDHVYLYRVRGVGDLKSVMGEADSALFRIAGDGTPFAAGARLSQATGVLPLVQPFTYGGPAADIFDYLLVLRGSDALTPWRGEAHDITASGQAD